MTPTNSAPPVATKPTGMRISLPGVLERAAVVCERSRDWKTATLAFSLRELLKHIEIVRAEPHRVQEFLDLWVSE